MPLVGFAEPASRETERLTRIAASDEIHDSTPRSAVEGSHIIPHRTGSHVTLLHRLAQIREAEGFPLHHADDASCWICQLDAEIKPADSGAEAKDSGVMIHATSHSPSPS